MKLSELNTGDVVILSFGGWRGGRSVEKIDRATPTQFIVRGEKYRRETGRKCGDAYSSSISVPKEGEIESIRRANRTAKLAQKIASVDWRGIQLEKLEQVAAILEATTEAKP